LIELIIAVLSMLVSGPLTDGLTTSDDMTAPVDRARIVPASTTIDDMALAPGPADTATASTPAYAGSDATAAPTTTKIDLPVYTLIGPETKLQRYVNLASKRLDPRMQGAIRHIADDARRLLALKYYARRRGSIDGRWALSSNQIVKYNATKEHRTAVALVEAIRLRFAEDNPGYHLKVNTDVRTLEKQIEIWNTFPSTAQAGESLLGKAERALADSTRWPANPRPSDLARFTSLVASAAVSRTPTAAVPGLSLHGTGRAFDFIVYKGDEIVAGAIAETAGTVWDKAGWTKKLHDAVAAVSGKFDGPLRGPYEPWHYNYAP
jgi:hypothetical protein